MASKFFGLQNLVSTDLTECVPWEFKPTENITVNIREVKQDRQDWYSMPSTKHNFYTAIEPHSPNLRCNDSNPPRMLHALVADYDAHISQECLDVFLKDVTIKPTWIERSLGGNLRLVWEFPRPICVDSKEFCIYFLQKAMVWLKLGLLPLLDEPAFTDPMRLLCNGCDWKPTGFGPIDEAALQSFFVTIARAYRVTSTDVMEIPIDVVEKELRKKYPTFQWPTDFVEGSQGPSFWVEGSTSPMSAIVKSAGMITWAGHATKFFYSWGELLGKEFVKQFADNAIAVATADIYFDSKNYWRKIDSIYTPCKKDELTTYFKVIARLNDKAGKEGVSQITMAFSHIHECNHIRYAAPQLFRKSGIFYNDRRQKTLNTYDCSHLEPAAGTQTISDVPFLWTWFNHMFGAVQLPYALAWGKHFYECAVNHEPEPGPHIVMMGAPSMGKTLVNRFVFGKLVGGFMDASSHLMDGGTFNSHLFHVPLWVLDDDMPANNPAAQALFHARFKKMVSNQEHKYEAKYEIPGLLNWAGRIGMTTNLDNASCAFVGPLDNMLDRVNLFRCISGFNFPSRVEIRKLLDVELPKFGRLLLDYTPPDYITKLYRFGYTPHHDKGLLDHNFQSSASAPFRELLIRCLLDYWRNNPKEKIWKGTLNDLSSMMAQVDGVSLGQLQNTFRVGSIHRYMEQVHKEKLFGCEFETGSHRQRYITFHRPEPEPTTDQLPVGNPQ